MTPYLITLSPFLKRVQTIIWLSVLLFLLVLALVLYIYAKTLPEQDNSEMTPMEKSVASLEAVEVNERINKLNDLTYDVAPVEFQTIIRDLRDYPEEFKDKLYIDTYKRKWTLQIMNVSKHDIILDYLNRRTDRKDFAYFRYSDRNNQSRFILTYGKVNTLDEAMSLSQEIDFGLPKHVKATPEEMKRYSSLIDNYERKVTVMDMSHNRPRSVNLSKTNALLKAPKYKKPKPVTSTDDSSTEESLPIVSDSPDTAAKILTLPSKIKSVLTGTSSPKTPKADTEDKKPRYTPSETKVKKQSTTVSVPSTPSRSTSTSTPSRSTSTSTPSRSTSTPSRSTSTPSRTTTSKSTASSNSSTNTPKKVTPKPTTQPSISRNKAPVATPEYTEPEVTPDIVEDEPTVANNEELQVEVEQSQAPEVDDDFVNQFEPINNNSIINDSYSTNDIQNDSIDADVSVEPFVPDVDEPVLD